MSEPMSLEERAALMAKIRETDARLYPPKGQPRPEPREAAKLLDLSQELLGQYGDRLPRVLMSACPFTGAPLKRAFDPYDLSGYWWLKDRTFTPEEPVAPTSFRTLLGALDLHGREPGETTRQVLAGPGVPFVVPRLLELPDMVAVIHRVQLATGDTGYPIGYFSRERFHPALLHQHWTRPELWFETEDGESGWTIANDAWDFELQPWVDSGRLRWLSVAGEKLTVLGADSGAKCPYVGLPGDRESQSLGGGRRTLEGVPSGEPPDPFAS